MSTTAAELPAYLTKTQAAEQLSCSTKTVDRLERDGFLSPVRHKRFVRYPREQVLALPMGPAKQGK
jgi:hypothetical protein